MSRMKIDLRSRDEGWLHDGEVAVPLEITAVDETATVEFYPSAKPIIDEFLALYGDEVFSDRAIRFAVDKLGGFLSSYGFSLSPDSEDYYINYTIPVPCIEMLPEVRRLTGDEGFDDLTQTDIDGLIKQGYIIYASVVDNKIVAVANTGEPINAHTPYEVEIGVDTAQEYRRRGYGRSCVIALVRELADMGHGAIYECASQNTASVRLAEGLGGKIVSRKFYIVGFKD